MKRFCLLPLSLLLFGTTSCVRAQEQARATLDQASEEIPPEYHYVRATLGGSSDGRTSKDKIASYSSLKNILEIEYGKHNNLSDSGWDSEGDTVDHSMNNYLGISYIHKFSPHFGLGLGYEKISSKIHISKYSSGTSYYYYYGSYYQSYNDKSEATGTSTISTYKLLLRYVAVPDKVWNPELTIGLGGFTEQDNESWYLSENYYDSYSDTWTYYYYSGNEHPHCSGFTSSVSVGLRYNLTKRFSIGAKGSLAYFKPEASAGSIVNFGDTGWWHWYQYGAFAGVGF